jgi:Protein of unknown function (DUF1592)/Protein of unknown function (DUF1588)/Protein of unknown function (DUF1595)/Protein of unknown function (DUF1587)
MRSTKRALVWATLAAGGCYSGTHGAPAGETDTDTAGSGTAAADSDDDGETEGVPEGCEPTAQPIRRLSHTEYEHTLRDLFGAAALPALDLVADPRVGGFSNNAAALAPSDLLTRQYYEAARALAGSLDVTTLASCNAADAGCDEQLVRELGLRVFRRPLTDDEVERLMSLYDAGGSFEVGARLVVQTMLLSPEFLYRPELGTDDGFLTGYETASRLSYFLWATMPDDALLQAAADGELDTQDGVEAQVVRMLADDKARDGMLLFHREWLDLERVEHVLKLPEEGFDAAYAESMRESAERFVWETLFENEGSLRELLTSSNVPVDATMAALLGVDAPTDGWETVSLDPTERAGILTHPAFLASHAYAAYPSPVLRGVFVMDRVMCNPPAPPPEGVNTTLPEPDDTAPQTNREWYEGATTEKGGQCAGCHTTINPLGYAFEHYDAMGRFRAQDNGFAVDASGAALGLEFGDAIEMSSQLGSSDAFSECVVDKWIAYATGGAGSPGGGCVEADLRATLAQTDMNAVELVATLAMHPMYASAPVVGEES